MENDRIHARKIGNKNLGRVILKGEKKGASEGLGGREGGEGIAEKKRKKRWRTD